MKRFFILLFSPFLAVAQFAPAAGQSGSTAIKKDSSIILNWANMCRINRGFQDISSVNLGYASYGDSSKAMGPADGANVVSLGDGGNAILTFPQPITNGNGFDFCVFENAFDPGYLELAFVEVSSDGVNFSRFPSACNVQNTLQIGPFDIGSDPSKINNLAGKYIAGFATPFDLQELAGSPGLDIDHITHVKIIDVVGCIQPAYARYDSNNNQINDTWPTPYPSCGFDLDAVGVMHQAPVGIEEHDLKGAVQIFIGDGIRVYSSRKNDMMADMMDMSGKNLANFKVTSGWNEFPLPTSAEGIYLLRISDAKTSLLRKFAR